MSVSHVTATVDFDRPGKQIGVLHIPHSVTRSAYGTLPIPLAVIHGGPGPSLLLAAGNHGDEYEGQIVLTRLVQSLQPDQITGRLIIIPALNLPAVLAGTRTSPLDEGNLNRAFPGDPHGGPTWKIAHYIEHTLLPMVDVVCDFHAGGGSLAYRPHASTHFASGASEAHQQRSIEAACALGVPHVLITQDPKEESLPGAAVRSQVISLGGEFGGTGTVTLEILTMVRAAASNLLAFFGVKGTLPADRSQPTRIRNPGMPGYVYAPESGVFEPAVRLGDWVAVGDVCGYVVIPENPTREPVATRFAAEGQVVCQRYPSRVQAGDCLAHLAVALEGGGSRHSG